MHAHTHNRESEHPVFPPRPYTCSCTHTLEDNHPITYTRVYRSTEVCPLEQPRGVKHKLHRDSCAEQLTHNVALLSFPPLRPAPTPPHPPSSPASESSVRVMGSWQELHTTCTVAALFRQLAGRCACSSTLASAMSKIHRCSHICQRSSRSRYSSSQISQVGAGAVGLLSPGAGATEK